MQHLGRLYHLPVDHQVKIVPGLSAHGLDHLRTAVTDIAHAHAGDQVHIPAVTAVEKDTIRPVYL